jgi:hypothetical protein
MQSSQRLGRRAKNRRSAKKYVSLLPDYHSRAALATNEKYLDAHAFGALFAIEDF